MSRNTRLVTEKTANPATSSVRGRQRRARYTRQPQTAYGTRMSPTHEEVGVGQAERQQPTHAAVVPHRGPSAPGLDPVGEEADSGAEQEGKEGEELLAGEQVTQGPDAEVDPREVAPGRRVAVRRDRHREELDIHHQDAEQSEAAQHVQTR